MFQKQHCPQCDAVRPPGAASCRICGLTFDQSADQQRTPAQPWQPPQTPWSAPQPPHGTAQPPRGSAQQPQGTPRSDWQTPPHGMPRPIRGSSTPVLVLRVLAELPTQEFEIVGRSMEIGRLPEANITLAHRSVSRQHARVSPSAAGGYVIEDLGSKNGTWINDQPISTETPLNNGDTLLIGDVPLHVSITGGVEDTAPEIVPSAPERPAAPGTGFVEKAPVPAAPASPGRPLPPGVPSGPSTVMIDVDDALSEGAIANFMPAPAWDTPPTPLPIPRPPTPPVSTAGKPTPPAPAPAKPATPVEDPDEHPTVFELTPLSPDTDAEPPAAQPWTAQPAPPWTAQPAQPWPGQPQQPAATPSVLEPAAVNLVEMAAAANKLAAELRAFSADLSTAVWLFEHAGGGEAAQSFVQRVNAAHAQPDDSAARQKVLEEAPTAARLLQAALMLFNALVPLEGDADQPSAASGQPSSASELRAMAGPSHVEAAEWRDQQPQSDTTELEPIARP